MASPEWVEIYTNADVYSIEELREEIAMLKKELKDGLAYNQQNSGSKGFERDLDELRGRLAAAGRALVIRSGRGSGAVGIMDFSDL